MKEKENHTGHKRLIEWGWDQPDPQFMREHADQLVLSPFDGTVFALTFMENGLKGSFTWSCWGQRRFAPNLFEPAVAALKLAELGHMRSNFLRVNVTPGDVDWFDDFGPILANVALAAGVAYASRKRVRGIAFDPEAYAAPLWDYPKQKYASERTREHYGAQVRQRGREVMRALQEAYPGLVLFMPFGYELTSWQPYTLMREFLDGLYDAVRGRTVIVDAGELAYSYKEPAQFADLYQTIRSGVLPTVAEPKSYRKHLSIGFGLWMDWNSGELGWKTDDLEANYFSPSAFNRSLKAAIARSDRYTWVYTQQPRWWSEEGGTIRLPAAYVRAVQDARPLRREES